ncbi:MAG: alpha-galactosidase [Candidatus Coproplasma sp.]
MDGNGRLQNLHYGSKIPSGDIAYAIEQVGEPVTRELIDLNFYANERIFSECGVYGRGDYRSPSIVIEREDGGLLSEFYYVRHTIGDSVPETEGLPHVRCGGQTLTIFLRDLCSDAEIQLNYTVYDDSDVLVRNLRIVNEGKQPFYIKKAFSFCTDLPDRNYKILRLHGAWTRERTPEITDLGHGITRLQSLCGASSFGIHPFLGLLEQDCSETNGICYGVQLVYSGSFALTAERNAFGTVRLSGGINDEQFCWEVGSGKSFVTPQALLCYSERGLGELSREYADLIRGKIMNPEFAFAQRPIVINNWEATYFDFDRDKLFSIIDEAAKLGVDTFVLDDGWFGNRNSDSSGLGDWYVNEKKLVGGLTAVIDQCKMRGLKFGLWFEPEMVSPDSDLYRAHPDWAIHKNGVEPVRGRRQLVLDFTKKEVVDYIYALIAEILRTNEISYIKWDMNRFITECYSESLPSYRQGEFMHRYILGVYDLAERLVSKFPKVFFEGCASGGGRFDAGMLYYFPQIWTSDDTDGYERAKIQWGTSLCYPVSGMSCHVSACPNHQTGRTTPISTRGAIASLGASGYELDVSALSDEEKNACRNQITAYRKISGLVLRGDLFRLSDPFSGKYFCEMIVSKDKRCAYVVGEQLRAMPLSNTQFVKLIGLAEEKLYGIEELNVTASGKTLASVGVPLPKIGDYESFIWHITEVKNEQNND